jgi:hypothetical protein
MMNRGERSSRDPRRGLPSVAERQKTNVPLEDNGRSHSEREAIERPIRALDDNRPVSDC